MRLPFERLEDWMYIIDGELFGGFTIQVLRKHMSPEERESHDAAWGVGFAPTEIVRLRCAPSPAGDSDDPGSPAS